MKRFYFLPTLFAISFFSSLSFARTSFKNYNEDKTTDSESSVIVDSFYNDSITAAEDSIIAYTDSVIAALYPHIDVVTLASSRIQPSTPTRSYSPTPDIFNPAVPYSITIDTSKSVGEIPIKSGVSPTGGKTYDIPIEIASGMNGLQPNISLSYSSQRRNSEVGMGWAISGLSRIERTSQSLYYDDKTQGVEMKNTDAFNLDGTRLIKLSQQSDHILYESEIGHIKVKGYFSGTIMKYFEVFYPDGRKGVFGESSNTSNLAAYPLMSLSDLWGNTITYSYMNLGNHPYIQSIQYNGCSVQFNYTFSRPDELVSYCSGIKESVSLLLSSVTSKLGSTELRTYTLTHSTVNGKTYLTELGCSSGSSSLNPLHFYYGTSQTSTSYNTSTAILPQYYSAPNPNLLKTVIGQFDYNNNANGLIVTKETSCYFQYNTNNKKYFDNFYASTDTILLYTGLDGAVGTVNQQLQTEDGFINILCADLEGKQQEYIVKINNRVVNNQDQITFKVYRMAYINNNWSLSLLLIRQYSFSTVYTYNGRKSIQPKSYYFGDFNGDGKMEIMAVSTHQPFGDTTKPSICYIFDLIGDQILYQGHVLDYCQQFVGTQQPDPIAAENNSDKLFVMDYDGDGKSDLCHINTSGTSLYTFDVSGTTYSPRLVNTYTALTRWSFADTKWGLGDFNGDGLVDIVNSPSPAFPTFPWYIYRSKGNGDFDLSSFAGPTITDYDNTRLIVHDVNGDGMSDLLRCDTLGFSTHLCSNNTFSSTPLSSYATPNTIFIPININTRNTFIQIVSLQDFTLTRFEFQRNDRKEQLMTGMANSLGIIEKNEYLMQRGPEASAIIQPVQNVQYTPTYPYITLREPLPLLYRSEHYMNGTKFDMDRYCYGDAVYHRQGLGFRGFTLFTRNDYHNRTYNQIFDVEHHSVPVQEYTPTAQIDLTYSTTHDNNKIAHIRMTTKDEYNPMNGVTAHTTYSYYLNDYPSSETTTYGGSDISIEKQYSYDNNTSVGDGYYLGYPCYVTTTISDNDETYTMWEQTTHDRLKPLTRKRTINSSYISQESFTYDNNGNKLSETFYPYSSSNALLTTYTYNGYGQLSTKSDPLGVTSSYTYDNFGRIGSVSDTNGDDDQYSYDAFSHVLVHNHNSSQSIDSCTYSWSTGAPNSLYHITRHQTGKPYIMTYYDALNREVRTSDKRFDGNYRHTDKTYDNYGLLAGVSLPYKSGTASCWNTYSYDSYGRIIAFAEASGRTTTYSYNGLSTTTTEDGVSTTRTYDVLGRLVSATDFAGTVTYELAPDGQPNSITAPGNIVTSFTYNNKRQKISMDDPSAGTTTYNYNLEGYLYKTTDARGRNIYQYYDLTGRPIRTEYPEVTVYRTYNNRNQLTSVTANGISQEMTYDGNGRLSTWKETVDSVWLQKDYTYSNNNLSSVTYTSHRGFMASENYGYVNGTMTSISKNGTLPIFQLTQENDLGLPTGVTTLNLTRTYSYTSAGIPTGRTASGPSSIIQNESYNFNAATSNLLSRTDIIRNLTDQFTYDNLNRLSSYRGASALYDSKGNIISKSDVGSFTYNNSLKPYAVTGANATSGTISTNTQDITYNTFPRASQIAEGAFTLDFTYDGSLNRVKEEVKQSNTQIETRYTLGGCYDYIIGSTANQIQENLYLAGGYDKAPILVQRYNDGSSYISHLVRDYQGSIMSQVDSTGYWHNDWSYDAWGRPRNPQTHVVYNPSILNSYSSAYRGYCGHEHLPQFGLINMNARLYDPVTSRFLSPDPYVQVPDNTQSFNRYSYCLNNPTKYTDPSGEFWHYIIGAVIGGVTNLIANWNNIDGFWQGVVVFGAGAGAGIAAAATGGASIWTIGGVSALSGAGTAATNSIVAQTGKNFSGIDNVSWGAVGKSSIVGGVAGAAGGVTGYYVSSAPWLVNNISSPVARSAVASPIAAGAGHIAGGTTYGLLEGQSLGTAFSNSFEGLGSSIAVGGAVGIASTIGDCYFRGINPWNGNYFMVPNDGFDPAYGINEMTLDPGTVVDRYGKPSGVYVAPEGTPFEQRTLTLEKMNYPYYKYIVTKPIPNVQYGIAAPSFWIGAPGGGVQYKLPYPIDYLINAGYLQIVP